MAKTLIVCCDGTWNKPDQQGRPTNVTKMARAVLPTRTDGGVQIVYYDEGVGNGNMLDRFLGGTLGIGLSDNVQQAYRFLAHNHEPGDTIALFGFSRGAFTVRSLAGLVGLVGLLRKGDLDQMPAVWRYYRKPPAERRGDDVDQRWVADRRPHIDFLGVWDTVGSLGIPGNILGRLGRSRYAFHDVTLGQSVRRAYHALAIDEHRRNFAPAVWDTSSVQAGQKVEQVWFAGAHSNVGGGYSDPILSDIAFLWMCQKADEVLELDQDFLARRVERVEDGLARGLAVDSASALKWKLLGRIQRRIGVDPSEAVHPSALTRLRVAAGGGEPPFRPFPYAPANLKDYYARFPPPEPIGTPRSGP